MPNDLLFMSKPISCLPLHSQQTALAQHLYHLLVYEFIGIRHGCKLFTINIVIIQNCVGVLIWIFLIKGNKNIFLSNVWDLVFNESFLSLLGFKDFDEGKCFLRKNAASPHTLGVTE